MNVQQAMTQLSDLIARTEAGEDTVIARAGRPVVRPTPIEAVPARTFGPLRFTVPDDFDEPLAEDELRAWE